MTFRELMEQSYELPFGPWLEAGCYIDIACGAIDWYRLRQRIPNRECVCSFAF